MKTSLIGSAVACLFCLVASTAVAWPPTSDQPGSGEITIGDLPGASAGLSADQRTYAPGSVATLSGIGFLPGEAVSVQVVHDDGSAATGAEHLPWRIAAGHEGAFVTDWRVCTDDCVGKVLHAMAVGEVSGRSAEVHFINGAIVGEPPAPPPSPPGDKPGSGEITIEDTPGAAASLSADQGAYTPGGLAKLMGAGFLPSEAVSVQVLHRDGTPASGADHWPWRISADQEGAFHTAWPVCAGADCIGKQLRAVAVGEVSGLTAEVIFANVTTIPPVLPPRHPGGRFGSDGTMGDSPGGAPPVSAEFSLRQNHPNPFGRSTVIRFSLPEASTVRIQVFDVLGQEVATLASGTMSSGSHSVTWNGRDRGGRPLAAGMYFCRMDAIGPGSGAFHQLRRMTLIR